MICLEQKRSSPGFRQSHLENTWQLLLRSRPLVGAGLYQRRNADMLDQCCRRASGPAVLRGLLAGLIEHVATWPMTVLVDRYHPARKELPKLAANRRAFGQATIRHAVFGIVLGLLEDALNYPSAEHVLAR